MSIGSDITRIEKAKEALALWLEDKAVSPPQDARLDALVALLPQQLSMGGSTILVTAPTGSDVTAAQNGQERTAQEQGGTWSFPGCGPGAWTIRATLGGQQAQTTLEITEQGQLLRYEVAISYFAAAISVTYPAGSSCKCSKGATVFTAPDQSGSVAFTVPEAGAWVVSCEDGTGKAASQTVSITENGQQEAVVLDYTCWLFNGGDQRTPLTGGWIPVRQGSSGTLTASDTLKIQAGGAYQGIIGRTSNIIDVSHFSTLYFRVITADADTKVFVTGNSEFHENGYAAFRRFDSKTTNSVISIDISSVSGSYYIAMSATGTRTVQVDAIWME